MKQFVPLITAALSLSCAVASAQQQAPPHKIGLIDMAHVFKNYQKFTALTEALQREVESSDGQARSLIEQLQQIEKQLTSGDLQEGSPDFVRLETQMVEVQTRLQSLRQTAQREFLRKEAELYKTVYLEVEEMVRRYATHFNYTLVMRFDRKSVGEAENPRDIINGMNRQVLYYHQQDDLTDPILEVMNDVWRKQQAAGDASLPARR